MRYRIILLFLFLGLNVQYAQIQTLWTKTSGATSMPSWFTTTNTERGFCYSNGKLYVVSRNAGTFVRVLDAETGNDVGTLSTVGISGTTFPINDIESTFDGTLYAMSLSTTLADTLKIYMWPSTTADPVLVFKSTFNVAKRIGDNFTIIGNQADKSFSIWCADPTNQRIYEIKNIGTGDTLSLVRTIQLPTGALGSAPSVYPIPGDTMIVTNSAGKYAQAYSFSGVLMDQVSGTIVGTGTTTTKLFNILNSGFMVTFQYASGNLRIIDTEGGSRGAANFRSYVVSPALGTNANANGSGDIAIKANNDTTVTIFHLGTNNGIAAYKISVPPIVNGRFHEPYKEIAQKQNNNTGFNSNVKLTNLRYGIANNKLYLALSSAVDKTNSQGIVLFLGLNDYNGHGAPAGTALGGVSGISGALGNVTNGTFKNDFETHYAFFISPLTTDSSVFIDVVKYTGTNKQGVFLGRCKQDGTAGTGPETAGFFTAGSITFAFDTAYSEKRGFELALPFTELGITSFSGFSAFACAVTNDALFSNITLPGNVSGANLQANPNFATISGGPFHATVNLSTPVELSSFQLLNRENGVLIQWKTATETNNRQFAITRSFNGIDFEQVAVVNGAGNTTQSSSYQYFDQSQATGNRYYRLYQTDFNGSSRMIAEKSVNFSNAVRFALEQNFPNPFNPATQISFSIPSSENVRIIVLNSLGQEVKELLNEKREAGQHVVSFNASGLSSGIYYYKLQSGSFISVKKMVILK